MARDALAQISRRDFGPYAVSNSANVREHVARLRCGGRDVGGWQRRALRVIGGSLSALAVLGVTMTVSAVPASAAAGPSFTFEPSPSPNSQAPRSSFRYSVEPGATISDSVLLTNLTNQTEDFEIWTANAYNVQRTGYLALRPQTYPRSDLATWIRLPVGVGVHQLPAGTSATLHFDVAVPPDASPGDHVAGIVALDVTPQQGNTNGTQFQIHQGIASALFLRVIGPIRPGAAVVAVNRADSVPPFAFITGSSHAFISYALLNTGNTLLNGTATVRVTDIFGRTVKSFAPTTVADFLPGQRFTVVEPMWHPLPIIGPEHIQVTFKPTGAPVASGGAVFWVVPWLLILFVLAVFGAWYWRHRRRRRQRLDQGPSGDHVEPPVVREPVAAAT